MPKIRGACPKPPQLNATAATAPPRILQQREHGGATVVTAPWLSAAEVRAKHVQKRETSITGRPGGAGAEMPVADPPPYIIAIRTFDEVKPSLQSHNLTLSAGALLQGWREKPETNAPSPRTQKQLRKARVNSRDKANICGADPFALSTLRNPKPVPLVPAVLVMAWLPRRFWKTQSPLPLYGTRPERP